MFHQIRSHVLKQSPPALRNNKEFLVHKGDVFHVPKHALYLVKSGTLHLETMCHNAGSELPKRAGILLPGDPVGVLEKYTTDARFCYRATEDSVLKLLTDDYSCDHKDNYLTAQIFKALSQVTLRLILSHSTPDKFRGYPRIRTLIYRYMEMKWCGELREEKLVSFILSHTSLPEAQVASVLSSLTERAYLDIRRGKLNAINFPLPSEYPEQEDLAMADPIFRMMG